MEKRRIVFIFIITFISGLWGCAKKELKPSYTISKILLLPATKRLRFKYRVIHGKKYYPVPGLVQRGIASWYGKKFHGRKTANGEIYNMYKRTAAHRTLPFGTYVMVRNLKNNKKTVVRINDRGPFIKNRIIDLSYRAAKDIGLIGPGTAPVELIVLGKEIGKIRSPIGKRPVVEIKDIHRGRFGVQVAAFRTKKNALKLVDRLSVIFSNVEIQVGTDTYANPIYRVIISGANSIGKANLIEKKLRDIGFKDAFVIAL